MATLAVRLLGGFRLEHAGAPVDLGSARAQALFSYLLLERGKPLTRATLAYRMWPDTDEAQARTNLRKVLYQVRRAVPEVDRFMVLRGQHVAWRVDAPFELDVQRFEEAVACAGDAPSPEREVACLAVAAEAYAGDLLPESYEPWLEPERGRLRDAYARVLERLAGLHEALRDPSTALRYAQRLVRHDPLDEGCHRRLMRLHALCGQRAKALHVFHGCVSVFQRELGIDPSAATWALYESLLSPKPGQGASAADPAGVGSVRFAPIAPTLVGREPHMASLRDAWLAARQGRASMVFVRGDAGIGKTRLAQEFVTSVPRREAGFVSVRCHAAEGALALAPLSEVLRSDRVRSALADLDPVWRGELGRLLPDLAEGRADALAPITEGWQRQRLFEALARGVLMGQPLVMLVDDLPWCDRDTLEWFHFLLRFDAEAKLLLIGTARAHDVDSNPALVELLGSLRREERLLEVEVDALDEAQTGSLVRSMRADEPTPRELEVLFSESEGNPLFVVEMVREGVVESSGSGTPEEGRGARHLPAKLREVIAARLGQLESEAMDLVGMAAVIGRAFGFELLVRVSRQDEERVLQCLDALWRRRIVREVSAGRYDFSHDKLREVAYEALSLTRRRLLHRYVAEALEAETAEGGAGLSGKLAYHYDRAGFPERAIENYRRAAEEALSLYAHAEALGAYHRALELLEGVPASRSMDRWRHDQAADLHEGIGDVLTVKGDHEAAERRFVGALEHHPDGEGVARARLWRKIGITRMSRYAYTEALEAYEAAETALGQELAGRAAAWWYEWIEIGIGRSWLHYWRVEWRENAAVLARLEQAIDRHATLLQRGNYYRCLSGMLMARERFNVSDEAVRYLRAGLAASREAGVARSIALAQFNLGFGLLWRDELDESQALIEEALRYVERAGIALMRVRCITYLAFIHRKRRALETAQAYALLGLELANECSMPEYAGAAHGHLSWLAWRRGDFDQSIRQGWSAVDRWREGQPYMVQWSAYLPLLAATAARGRFTDAVACAAALLAPQQQRLPDPLNEALEHAARGDRAALERVVALAEEARLL